MKLPSLSTLKNPTAKAITMIAVVVVGINVVYHTSAGFRRIFG